MGKKLLREFYELCEGGVCQDLLTEAEKRFVSEGGMILSGIMQMCETLNGNGRVYTRPVLEREVKKYQQLVEQNRALGELDHPDKVEVSLEKVSHKVNEIWMDGNKVMGKIQVLETPAGKTLRALVEGGCSIGISSRGTGSVTERNGKSIVQEDFELVCFDVVSEPSTPGAFMMREAKEFGLKEGKQSKINQLIDEVLDKN
jgi:hypothetical protein|tara:strand:- start:11338 stop:11940 length:603 start_codon:yes stop_codon:yes gene_type:complete